MGKDKEKDKLKSGFKVMKDFRSALGIAGLGRECAYMRIYALAIASNAFEANGI
jgi:hypothetical protein